MDLTIQEVSTLLQVSEDQITTWLDEGKIPAYKIQDEVRFSREEIEDFVVRSHHEVNRDQEFAVGMQHFNLFRAIHKGFVFDNIEGSTKEEIIRNTMSAIAKDLDINPDGVADLLLEREEKMSTALNEGVALPHTRDFLLNKTHDIVAIVYPKEPIDYGALDQKPVHTLFFMFACQDKRHLNLIAKIAYFCNQKENIDFLKGKPSKKDVLSQVRAFEGQLTELQTV